MDIKIKGYSIMNDDIIFIKGLLELAYESGRWRGQVDLEEHLDNEQYSSCVFEVLKSRKTGMPIDKPSKGRTIKYNLRSDIWREKVKKESYKYLEKILFMYKEYYSNRNKFCEKI